MFASKGIKLYKQKGIIGLAAVIGNLNINQTHTEVCVSVK